jgi:hypothetical protein
VPGKVQIVGAVDGDKVQVSMRYFEANHGNPAPVAGKGAFDGFGDRPGEKQQISELVVGQVEEFVDLYFRHYKRMPFPQGKDIQESEELIVLRDFIRRYLSRDDL